MLEQNGLKYSREAFDDYKLRVKAKFVSIDDVNFLDIFTTDTDRESVLEVLQERRGDRVITVNIVHWSTREQDDIASEFIDEWLKEV